MKALILAGKSNFSTVFPTVLGESLLSQYLRQLKDFDVYVNVLESQKHLVNIAEEKLIVEKELRGNFYPILQFIKKFGEEFICIHYDIFTNLDFNKFVRQIKRKENEQFVAILVTKNIGRPHAFGILTFDKNKTALSLTRRRYVNCGIYYFKPEIANYCPQGEKIDLDLDVFPLLIEQRKLGVYTFNGLWYDIGDGSKIEKIRGKK